MTTRTKIIVTVLLLIFLCGLGFADYFFSSGGLNDEANGTGGTTSGALIPDTDTEAILPPGAVRKQSGPPVEQTITDAGFTTGNTNDLSFLSQIAGSGAEIHALAILQNGDRAGAVTWMESPKVKNYFIALKEALLATFSPQVQDLRDETLQGENRPVRNMLTFFDPTLSTERLVFVRVRERFYEFHIAKGKEEAMNALIETMTTK